MENYQQMGSNNIFFTNHMKTRPSHLPHSHLPRLWPHLNPNSSKTNSPDHLDPWLTSHPTPRNCSHSPEGSLIKPPVYFRAPLAASASRPLSYSIIGLASSCSTAVNPCSFGDAWCGEVILVKQFYSQGMDATVNFGIGAASGGGE
jgi:hypothetical protein